MTIFPEFPNIYSLSTRTHFRNILSQSIDVFNGATKVLLENIYTFDFFLNLPVITIYITTMFNILMIFKKKKKIFFGLFGLMRYDVLYGAFPHLITSQPIPTEKISSPNVFNVSDVIIDLCIQ